MDPRGGMEGPHPVLGGRAKPSRELRALHSTATVCLLKVGWLTGEVTEHRVLHLNRTVGRRGFLSCKGRAAWQLRHPERRQIAALAE